MRLKNQLEQGIVMCLTVCLLFLSCDSEQILDPVRSAELQIYNHLDQVIEPDQRERFVVNDLTLTGSDYSYIRQYAKAKLITTDSLYQIFKTNGLGDLDVLPRALANCYDQHIQDSSYLLIDEYKRLTEKWLPIKECKELMLETAKNYYNYYNEGDTVVLTAPYYNYSTGYDIDIVEGFCGENRWTYNEQVDELYYGVVNSKAIKGSKSLKINLHIIYMNENFNRKVGNTIKLGDDIDFELNSPLIVKPFNEENLNG